MSNERYLTAKEAAEVLDVKVNTIYAYVSRGLIRSETSPKGKRNRRYLKEDVDKLMTRYHARSNPEQLTKDALHWGAPLLESALTLIDNGQLYYRGKPIQEIVNTMTVEDVASLIWTGDNALADTLFNHNTSLSAQKYETMLLHVEVDGADLAPIRAFQIMLPIASADDVTAYDMRSDIVAQKGARVLQLMASVAAGDVQEPVGIAEMLQRGWCPDDVLSARLFGVAMILYADHELNASSFAARIAASAGATPYEVINAGLSVLQGVKHGGYTESTEAFLKEISTPKNAKRVISTRMRHGYPITGFGHQLYPNGDPRARILCDMLRDLYPDSPAVKLGIAVQETVLDLLNEYPTIDFALALLGHLYNLPSGSTLGIFALGRTIGWIGHAIEQYETDRLIRPRARYTGEQPTNNKDN